MNTEKGRNRDSTIDILRGVAIFTMVAANMAPTVLVSPHPLLFRFYGSFAAPLFILVSGMMVVFTAQTKGHGLRYFLLRGAMIVTMGALIDVLIWRIIPFTTVDVLYLIGISLPLAYLFSRLGTLHRWIIVIFIFLATPLLQTYFGYTDYPTEFFLSGQPTIIIANQTGILNHWLIDGWFPIFPWLGFSLLGVNIAALRWNKLHSNLGKNNISLIGLGILAFGAILWWLHPGSLLTRAGYSELFYPPTIGYIVTAIGIIVILFSIVDRNPSLLAYKPLQLLGESALFMYILHLVLIEYVIAQIEPPQIFQFYLLTYIILSSFLISIAYGLKILKSRWKEKPFIIRFLLGG